MTREDKLYSMTGKTLIMKADELGVKIVCNKSRTALKEAKSKVIERILAAENAAAEAEETIEPEIMEEPKNEGRPEEVEEKQEELSLENVETVDQPKRGALIEFDGKAQNICAWGEELGISANTLYGRIYKMGWSVERAFTTPSRKTK